MLHSEPLSESAGGSPVKWAGMVLGPLIALLVYAVLPAAVLGPDNTVVSGLSHAGRAAAAVGSLMAVWWMTEAIPLPATALLPIVLFPLLDVSPIRQTTAPYANEQVFLFLGGFLLSLAIERWGLHRRVALLVISFIGAGRTRLVAGVMLATAILSMWVSNTATTMMMLPIGISIAGLVRTAAAPAQSDSASRNFPICIMLGIAYAASIGGMATPIGTPPNVFLTGYLSRELGIQISFAQWLMFGLPLAAVFLVAAWILLAFVLYPVRTRESSAAGKELIRKELADLGPMSRGEWSVLIVFIFTAAGWVFRVPLCHALNLVDARGEPRILDAGIAMTAGLALFLIPVSLKNRQFLLGPGAIERLPWGVILLFGGGLTLADAIGSTGVDDYLGSGFTHIAGLHPFVLLLIIVTAIVFFGELASNLALVTALVPILASAAIALNIDPLALIVPATLAASVGFMLPVATPPNAIAFSTGAITSRNMIRAGFPLDLVGIALVTVAGYFLVTWALKLV